MTGRKLRDVLAEYLATQNPPQCGSYYSVSREGVAMLALGEGISLNRAMVRCLEQGIWPETLRGNRGSLSKQDQIALLQARVAVLGAGGLGGMVILLLARMGVGALTVCDGDSFDESNLNRQFLATPRRLGRPKALAAAEEVATVNPAVEVTALVEWAKPDSLPRILGGAHVAVDCLDSLEARFWLEEAAGEAGLPYIHGAIAGMEGFVMTVYPGEPGLKGLYGAPGDREGSAEKILGVPTATPALIAGFQALEAAKVLMGKRGLGPGRVMHLDLGVPETDFLELMA